MRKNEAKRHMSTDSENFPKSISLGGTYGLVFFWVFEGTRSPGGFTGCRRSFSYTLCFSNLEDDPKNTFSQPGVAR
jgi:hypothetical protein